MFNHLTGRGSAKPFVAMAVGMEFIAFFTFACILAQNVRRVLKTQSTRRLSEKSKYDFGVSDCVENRRCIRRLEI